MSECEIQSLRFSVQLFVFQLLAVPTLILILGLIIFLSMDLASIGFIAEELVGYLVLSILGFALGYTFQSLVPRAIESGGRWIWIPPIFLLTWGCIDNLVRFGSREASILLWPDPEGEAGWGMLVFLMLPALACCFFSLGIVAAHRAKAPVTGASESL